MEFNPADIRVMVRAATQHNDEDLEQEASLRAIEAFRRTSDVRHPRAFLMKIVHDTVIDHWRRRKSHEDIESVDEKRLCEQCTIEIDLDRRRQHAALRQAIAALDKRKRSTINLYYGEELTIGEIARLQSRSHSAVKMDLLRSRRMLSRIVATLLNKKSR